MLLDRFGNVRPGNRNEFYQQAVYEENIYPLLTHVRTYMNDGQSMVELRNAIPRKVEVLNIAWVNSDSEERIYLASRLFPISLPSTGLEDLGESVIVGAGTPPLGEKWSIVAEVRMDNRPWTRQISAINSAPPSTTVPLSSGNLEELLARHPFLSVNQSTLQVAVNNGKWLITQPMIIPVGYSLSVPAGTQLRFSEQAALVVNGPLFVAGEAKLPVTFSAADTAAGWPGFAVMSAGQESTLQHFNVEGTTGVTLGDWSLTGGANFYQSDVLISHSAFSDSRGEDALNIIHSNFEIADSRFMNTASDAFDADFSNGTVERTRFVDIGKAGGGDAVDVSGSSISVIDSRFTRVNDKALSVGEASTMTARGLTMLKVGTAAAAKDGSSLTISDSVIDGAQFVGLTAYIKKPEYGAGKIMANGIEFRNTDQAALVQTGNSVVIDGQPWPTKDVDVDALYETIMYKGLRPN